jgi:hypothetical protein
MDLLSFPESFLKEQMRGFQDLLRQHTDAQGQALCDDSLQVDLVCLKDVLRHNDSTGRLINGT